MKDKTKINISLGIGTTSILMIFVILILVTFSILSLSGAKADHKLGDMTLKRAREYYQAENKAEKKLAIMDQRLNAAIGETDFEKILSNVGEISIDKNEKRIQYKETIDDKQYLNVVIQLVWNEQKQVYGYRKIKWQTVVTGDWTIDEDIPVFQP